MPPKTQDKNRYSTSQLLNFSSGSYLDRTSRPVYALVFLLPFIIFYEIGTLLINTDILSRSQIRVVAFVWLQDLLDYAGFNNKFTWIAAPLAVLVILLALQLTSRGKMESSDQGPFADGRRMHRACGASDRAKPPAQSSGNATAANPPTFGGCRPHLSRCWGGMARNEWPYDYLCPICADPSTAGQKPVLGKRDHRHWRGHL